MAKAAQTIGRLFLFYKKDRPPKKLKLTAFYRRIISKVIEETFEHLRSER